MCAVLVAACGALAFACATGGSSGHGSGDDVGDPMDAPMMSKHDASVSMLPDAPKADGSVIVQDATMQPDAPPGSLFCSNNAQCTTAGQCCFAINGQGFCVNGTVVLGVCFPQ
ncbi:MAG TPA: hypothetical protein VIV40_33545 [Kofleriaceae bacterium]